MGPYRKSRLIGLFLGTVLIFGARPAHGSHEAFAVYEEWTTDLIRADRWGGTVDSAQELNREVNANSLRMRLRKQGVMTSNSGFTAAQHRLSFVRPLAVDQIAGEFRVDNLTVTGCPANFFPSRTRPVVISLNKFSDGTPGGPGNLTGDHFGRIQVERASDSTDAEGAMRVQAILFRCIDTTCSNAFSVGPIIDFPDLLFVGDRFSLRLVWDDANNRFLAAVNDGPEAEISYPPTLKAGPARVPFAQISIFDIAANCTAAPTETDTSISVGVLEANTSSIVP